MNVFILLCTRFALPLWRASPTTLPAGHGHGFPACRQDTALVLTRRTRHGCSVRHSIGLRTVSPHRQASQLSPHPLCFFSMMTTAFTACSRPCREYAVSAVELFFLKAVWLSLSFVPDDGNGHTAFFVRCRGERPVFLGGSNHSPKNLSLLSFVLPCSCRPGHLIVPTAKVFHARLAASVFMQHL